jgi:hypothetical protein
MRSRFIPDAIQHNAFALMRPVLSFATKQEVHMSVELLPDEF